MGGYRNAIVNTIGLVAYWRMGETSGTLMFDELGRSTAGNYTNTPDLALSGALSGDTNSGVYFKAASVEFSNVVSFTSIVDTFSVEAWIKYPSTPGALVCFFSTQGTNVWLFVDTANKIQMWKANTGLMWTTTTVLVPNTLTHVVATKDGATSAIYINGVASALTGSNSTLTAAAAVFLSTIEGTSFPWEGSIDEVSVYRRVLAADEAANHYRMGRGF